MELTLKNTPEKYKKMVEKLLPPLLELLQKLTLLEEEIYECNKELDAETIVLKIPSHQIHPKWKDLMDEYHQRYLALIEDHVSEKCFSKGPRNSYDHPSEYSYLKGEDFFVQFTMKKEDRATVILQFEEALAMKHKFVLRLINDKWLIDEKFYGFGDEKIWYVDIL